MDTEDKILNLVLEADPDNPVEYVSSIVRPYARQKLDSLIRTCSDCPIAGNASVRSVTYGNDQASILIINDGIYGSQVKEGQKEVFPLQGTPEMEYMDCVFDAYHVNKEQLFWANAVNCYTCQKVNEKMIERAPSSHEAEYCRGYIDHIIKMIDPVMIILLGNIPYSLFHPGNGSVMQAHGKWIDVHGIKAMPVYSPRFLVSLRERDNKLSSMVDEYEADFCEDIRNAFLYVQDNFEGNVLLEPIED